MTCASFAAHFRRIVGTIIGWIAQIPISVTNVHYHLDVLAKSGQLVRQRYTVRALVVASEALITTLRAATAQNPNTLYWIEQGEIILGQLANPIVPLPRGTWMPPKPQCRR
jgi:hypothetical protein